MRWYVLGLCLIGLIGCAAPTLEPLTEQQAHRAARANTDLAIHYLSRDALEPAAQKIYRALVQNPNLIDAQLVAAELNARLSKPALAEQHYRNALQIEADSGAALNNYAVFLCDRDQRLRALDLWEMAANNPLYTGRAMALTNAGRCLNAAGYADQARTYWRRALEVQAQYAPALRAMAEESLARDSLNTARLYFSRYTHVSDETPTLLWLGVRIAKAGGDTERYEHFAQRLKDVYPLSDQAAQLSE